MPSKGPGSANAQPLHSKQFSRSVRDMIAFGSVSNWYYIGTRAHNPAVGTTTEDIWGAGGVQVWPSAAATASVVSTSANDTSAGTGARTVTIEGLDANYEEISESVTLNGVTPVVTTNSYLRVNSLVVTTSGSGEGNAGDITASVGGNVQRFIATGDGICHCSQFTIPAGHTGYLTRCEVWQGRDSSCDVYIAYKTTASGTWIRLLYQDVYRNGSLVDYDGAVRLPEKTDIRMQGVADIGSADIGAYYVIYLYDGSKE